MQLIILILHKIQALQTLLSNPAAMSVESLERAHREESRTPPTKDLESDLKSKLNISKTVPAGKQKGSNSIECKSNGVTKPAVNNIGVKQSYAGAAKSPNKRIQKVIMENNVLSMVFITKYLLFL